MDFQIFFSATTEITEIREISAKFHWNFEPCLALTVTNAWEDSSVITRHQT
jgi:hypothetical protein